MIAEVEEAADAEDSDRDSEEDQDDQERLRGHSEFTDIPQGLSQTQQLKKVRIEKGLNGLLFVRFQTVDAFKNAEHVKTDVCILNFRP